MEPIYFIWLGLFILGTAVGFTACFLVSGRRISTQREQLGLLQSEKDHLQKDFNERCAALLKLEEEKSALVQRWQAQSEETSKEISRLRELNARLEAKCDSEQRINQRLEEDQKVFETQMRTAFENIASRIFEEKSDKFSRLNEEKIKHVLDPLGKEIDSFRKKIEENYLTQTKERASLGTELARLMELNRRLSDDATALTKALKGEHNPKIQGDWGEMILENILTNSGLVRGQHYFTQESTRNAEGQLLRPDVVVRYPDGREIVVDSKVSLTAYSRYMAAADEEQRTTAQKEHLISVRRHIDQLCEKKYHDRVDSIDFVMMFMPVEPAYMMTLSSEDNLWEYAYRKKILLVSPTHLVTALKLVYDLWTRDSQNRNALQIAERGAALYEKFVGFVNDMMAIEKSIASTQKSFDAAMGKLSRGRGNLLRQAEMLRDLGVKADKELPIASSEEELQEIS